MRKIKKELQLTFSKQEHRKQECDSVIIECCTLNEIMTEVNEVASAIQKQAQLGVRG